MICRYADLCKITYIHIPPSVWIQGEIMTVLCGPALLAGNNTTSKNDSNGTNVK